MKNSVLMFLFLFAATTVADETMYVIKNNKKIAITPERIARYFVDNVGYSLSNFVITNLEVISDKNNVTETSWFNNNIYIKPLTSLIPFGETIEIQLLMIRGETQELLTIVIDDSLEDTVVSNESLNRCIHNLKSNGITTVSTVVHIDCMGKGITSVEGIQQFYNLETLMLSDNYLTKVDLSGLGKIEKIYLAFNKINKIDLNDNNNVNTLYLEGNNFEYFPAENLNNLNYLNISKNRISALDLSNVAKLKKLRANDNSIDIIDLSKNSDLREVHLHNNQLKRFSFDNLSKLRIVNLNGNPVESLDYSSVSLNELYISNTSITELDISNQNKISVVVADNNNIGKMILPESKNWNKLQVENNKLMEFYIPRSKYFNVISLEGNPLTQAMKTKLEDRKSKKVKVRY